MSVALFISDLHLSPHRPAMVRLFTDFLGRQASQADALYILGDLFEYWAGDDSLSDPFNATICASLKQLADRGKKLYFIAGNRDFLADGEFARASGAEMLVDPTLTGIAGIPTLLMHGDSLCSDDTGYQDFRRTVRSSAWRAAFLAQPLAARKEQIEALRRKSEDEKQTKAPAIMDVNAATVAAVLRSHGYPRLIHGHTHRPAYHTHSVDDRVCERWVLADWYAGGSYLACDERGCRAVTLQAP